MSIKQFLIYSPVEITLFMAIMINIARGLLNNSFCTQLPSFLFISLNFKQNFWVVLNKHSIVYKIVPINCRELPNFQILPF